MDSKQNSGPIQGVNKTYKGEEKEEVKGERFVVDRLQFSVFSFGFKAEGEDNFDFAWVSKLYGKYPSPPQDDK